MLPSPATVEPSMVSGKIIIGVSGGVASPTCEEGKGLGFSKLNPSALTRKWEKSLMNAGSLKQSVYLERDLLRNT